MTSSTTTDDSNILSLIPPPARSNFVIFVTSWWVPLSLVLSPFFLSFFICLTCRGGSCHRAKRLLPNRNHVKIRWVSWSLECGSHSRLLLNETRHQQPIAHNALCHTVTTYSTASFAQFATSVDETLLHLTLWPLWLTSSSSSRSTWQISAHSRVNNSNNNNDHNQYYYEKETHEQGEARGTAILACGLLTKMGFRGRVSVAGINSGTTNSIICIQKLTKGVGEIQCIPDPVTHSPIVPSTVSFLEPRCTGDQESAFIAEIWW